MPGAEQRLILVDSSDRVLGSLGRAACHAGEGRLHRAFSILVFDDEGRLLIQQRSAEKELWAGSWSNSCCGHPLEGEALEAAARRRVGEELGIQPELELAFRFQYAAPFQDRGSECELCAVFTGRYSGPVEPAASEIADWRWESPGALARALSERPGDFTPWFRVIWRILGLPGRAWDVSRDAAEDVAQATAPEATRRAGSPDA